MLRRSARLLGAVMSATAAVAMLASAVAVFWLHIGIQPVLSASMRPSFGAGAAVLTRQIPTSQVRPGDVILFRPPHQSTDYSHRVVSVSPDPGGPVITTKGDANAAPDAWKARLVEGSVPVVIGSVPNIGRLMVAADGAGTRVVLVLFAGLVFFFTGVRSILGPRPPSRPVSGARSQVC